MHKNPQVSGGQKTRKNASAIWKPYKKSYNPKQFDQKPNESRDKRNFILLCLTDNEISIFSNNSLEECPSAQCSSTIHIHDYFSFETFVQDLRRQSPSTSIGSIGLSGAAFVSAADNAARKTNDYIFDGIIRATCCQVTLRLFIVTIYIAHFIF